LDSFALKAMPPFTPLDFLLFPLPEPMICCYIDRSTTTGIGLLKGPPRQPELLDGLATAQQQKVFLEDVDKAFGIAVARRPAHRGTSKL
jgi:hypothetical protein